MTIEELKPLMRIPADASKKKVMRTFERIAEVLMNGCVLTKCGSVPNFLTQHFHYQVFLILTNYFIFYLITQFQ